MANFDDIYRIVMVNEGGYTNNTYSPNDLGGETYKGISRKWHPNWAGWKIIDGVKAVRTIKWNEQLDIYELKVLVKNFYKGFWNTMKGNLINTKQIAAIMYDLFVMTYDDAVKIAQRVLNGMGKNLVVDGKNGPLTSAAINSVNQEEFFYRYREARAEYHRAVAKSSAIQAANLPGWLARLDNAFPSFEKKKKVA